MLYGNNYLPEDSVLVFIIRITEWLAWYEYVAETMAYHEGKYCPDDVKDDPLQFSRWVKNQKTIDKKGKPYK